MNRRAILVLLLALTTLGTVLATPDSADAAGLAMLRQAGSEVALGLGTPDTGITANPSVTMRASSGTPAAHGPAACHPGPESPAQVKWNPGHYVTLPYEPARKATYMREVLDELEAHPVLRGVQKRYTWAELEPTEGHYDFSSIERDLALLSSKNKRLVILLQIKAFSETMQALPQYLEAAVYEGGSFELEIRADGNFRERARQGRNIKLWNAHVRDRLVLLACALGTRLNPHPNLEAVALTETAVGQAREPLTAPQLAGFFDGLVTVQRAFRRAFPNTVTLQFVNYPRSHIVPLVQQITAFGAGVGGPDVFLDDPGLHGGAYKLYPDLAGVVPLAPSVQPENYVARRHRGAFQPPPPRELYDFARAQLHANYLFWTRRLTRTERPWIEVLNLLRSPGFPTDPAGGLATVCPKVFGRCAS